MKRIWLSLCAAALILPSAVAQTLQFSQVFVADNNVQTVPEGKVWKVTAVYGTEYRISECVDATYNSTHELKSLRCLYPDGYYGATAPWSIRTSYRIGLIRVNGVAVVSTISGYPTGTGNVNLYNSTNCSGSPSNWSTAPVSCALQASDPNILPIWLPAGATLQTGGPNTFASVVEFTVVP